MKYRMLVLIFLISLFVFSVNAFDFNGYVYDDSGNLFSDVLVNFSNYTLGELGPSRDSSVNFTTNSTGFFNLSMDNNVEAMYKPSFRHTNSTYNFVDYIGQSLPSFPYQIFSELSNISIYLKQAATINITVINSTGDFIAFGYNVKDTKLGYEIAQGPQTSSAGDVIYVPKDRNYSILIYSQMDSGDHFVPTMFEWNNFSQTEDETFGVNTSYNATTRTLSKQFNVTQAFARISGYVNGSDNGVESWDNFTIIPYIVGASNLIFANSGTLPYNVSAWNGGESDFYNYTNGFYNITLPYSPAETVRYILFAAGYNTSISTTTYLGNYANITITGDIDNFNFTMYGLLGTVDNITLTDALGGASRAVYTNKLPFELRNSTGSVISSFTGHIETKVDYSNYGSTSFTFMNDITSNTGTYSMALLNETGIVEANIYSNDYAPKRHSTNISAAHLAVNSNITMKAFQPGGEGIPGQDAIAQSSINMNLYTSNSTCDVPNPDSKCQLTGQGTLDAFNPIKYLIGGGDISFRMGKDAVQVHYIKTDMLASGPPDALFEDNAGVTGSGDSFSAALKFGSNGPTIYDAVLLSMPYSEAAGAGLDDSEEVNFSMSIFYDDDWNVIWNTSTNGTNGSALAGNYSHYLTAQNDWETLMSNNTCTTGTLTSSTELNASNPCYLDATNNRIWIRIPYFSGTSPAILGSTIAAAASSSSSSSSSSSGGSGGSGGGAALQLAGSYAKQVWDSVDVGTKTKMDITDKGLAVSKVVFDVNKKVYGAWVSVTKKDILPSTVKSFNRKTYQTFDITKSPSLKDDIIEHPTINLKVETSWLTSNNILAENVALYHYVDGVWNELITTKSSDDGTFVYYSAETPGFSYFLVGEKEVKAIPEVKEMKEIKEVPTKVANELTGTVVSSEPSQIPSWVWIVLGLIVIAVLIWFWEKRQN